MKQCPYRFRWAACQLDTLQACLDLRMLRKALRSLPVTLEQTYGRILAGIDETLRDHAIRILQFLAYTKRPLKIQEAVDAIAVDLNGDPTFDPAFRLPEPREIAKVCASLVTLEAKQEMGGMQITYLQLAHFSVHQYLKSDRIVSSFPPKATESGMLYQKSLNTTSANAAITKVCLAYLSNVDIEDSNMPFSKYAAEAILWTLC
jgi:hypothetical protein